MPTKPTPMKKAPLKKAAKKEPEPKPVEPEPAPEPEPEPVPAPVEAPPAEDAPVEAAPVPEGDAVGAGDTPTAEGDTPAPAPAAEDDAAAPAADAPADVLAAPGEADVVEEPPKTPSPPPPPPAVPNSAPRDLTVVDVSKCTLTIKWNVPQTIGDSGLDGYVIEYCKDGTTNWVSAEEELIETTTHCIRHLTQGELLHMRVLAVNRDGRSEPGTLAKPVPIHDVPELPMIRLPRSLKSCYVKHIGEQVNLVIPFLGKPDPVVQWLKDGQPVNHSRVNIRNSDIDSILFIRSAHREDSGVYEISVSVDNFEDKCSFVLQIVDRPGSPAGVKLVDTWGFNAALEWTPPKDNGNTAITGYTIQKSDRKTGEWFLVMEHHHRLTVTVTDLVMGNSYFFRVFAENQVGISEVGTVTKTMAVIPKTGIRYKSLPYQEHDYSEAPTFTTPLTDHAATVGYTTRLLCSVRGCPKPKIEWLKNEVIIGNNPKFRQNSAEGICSLEIRKPTGFDTGVYTCRAKNDQGEAAVSCRLEVKQVIILEPEKEKSKKTNKQTSRGF